MITIPCDYTPPEGGRTCDKGEVLIYGEMGGPLPRTITCPKCHGTGEIKVARSVIVDRINELVDELFEINDEIRELKKLLTPA